MFFRDYKNLQQKQYQMQINFQLQKSQSLQQDAQKSSKTIVSNDQLKNNVISGIQKQIHGNSQINTKFLRETQPSKKFQNSINFETIPFGFKKSRINSFIFKNNESDHQVYETEQNADLNNSNTGTKYAKLRRKSCECENCGKKTNKQVVVDSAYPFKLVIQIQKPRAKKQNSQLFGGIVIKSQVANNLRKSFIHKEQSANQLQTTQQIQKSPEKSKLGKNSTHIFLHPEQENKSAKQLIEKVEMPTSTKQSLWTMWIEQKRSLREEKEKRDRIRSELLLKRQEQQEKIKIQNYLSNIKTIFRIQNRPVIEQYITQQLQYSFFVKHSHTLSNQATSRIQQNTNSDYNEHYKLVDYQSRKDYNKAFLSKYKQNIEQITTQKLIKTAETNNKSKRRKYINSTKQIKQDAQKQCWSSQNENRQPLSFSQQKLDSQDTFKKSLSSQNVNHQPQSLSYSLSQYKINNQKQQQTSAKKMISSQQRYFSWYKQQLRVQKTPKNLISENRERINLIKSTFKKQRIYKEFDTSREKSIQMYYTQKKDSKLYKQQFQQ